ncbi:hypothetical protein EDB83DRAFT_1857660 [Lactarius deliciosus]|nr:hypothetical protein EDB83DRAFT_1857660 [Lactarius deliciosus]
MLHMTTFSQPRCYLHVFESHQQMAVRDALNRSSLRLKTSFPFPVRRHGVEAAYILTVSYQSGKSGSLRWRRASLSPTERARAAQIKLGWRSAKASIVSQLNRHWRDISGRPKHHRQTRPSVSLCTTPSSSFHYCTSFVPCNVIGSRLCQWELVVYISAII